jgi:hypothetical protein
MVGCRPQYSAVQEGRQQMASRFQKLKSALSRPQLGQALRACWCTGGANRCWYWIRITLKDDENGVTHARIMDWIDPVLLHADPQGAHRARKARGIVTRLMREFMSMEGGVGVDGERCVDP